MIECCVCKKGPANGVPVYRINEYGIEGIWACSQHIKQTDAPPVPEDVRRIVRAISGKD